MSVGGGAGPRALVRTAAAGRGFKPTSEAELQGLARTVAKGVQG